jgi:hypothetical protein
MTVGCRIFKEITIAMWAGFKEYGLSLGYGQDAVGIHGSHFLEIMRQYHLNNKKYPLKFEKPANVIQCRYALNQD